MLPAPFYAELPTDLGDGQMWADQWGGSRHSDGLSNRPSLRLRSIADDRVATDALTFVSRVRSLLSR